MKWNEVTWYSKLLALILFVALPFLGFYAGVKYQSTVSSIAVGQAVITVRNEQPALSTEQINNCGRNLTIHADGSTMMLFSKLLPYLEAPYWCLNGIEKNIGIAAREGSTSQVYSNFSDRTSEQATGTFVVLFDRDDLVQAANPFTQSAFTFLISGEDLYYQMQFDGSFLPF